MVRVSPSCERCARSIHCDAVSAASSCQVEAKALGASWSAASLMSRYSRQSRRCTVRMRILEAWLLNDVAANRFPGRDSRTATRYATPKGSSAVEHVGRHLGLAQGPGHDLPDRPAGGHELAG